MSHYDENLRKVADALFVKADPKADQNVWDMAREVLKTVPRKKFDATVTAKATNYFVQASQPMVPLPEWVQKMGTPVEGDPNTIMVPADKVNLNLSPELQKLVAPTKDAELADLRAVVKRYREDEAEIRTLVGAVSKFDDNGRETQRESTVDAVKRVVNGYAEARAVCLEVREHVGIQGELVQAVKAMAEENNTLRRQVLGESVNKLLEILKDIQGPTLMRKVQNVVTNANTYKRLHAASQQDANRIREELQDFHQELREILDARDPSEDDNDSWSEGEATVDAARRVVRERDELKAAKVSDTVEGSSATKLLEILKDFSGRTLLDKVRDAVNCAGGHQAHAKRLQAELDEVRKALSASEADSWHSEDGNGYSMHETALDAAKRVVQERDESIDDAIKHSCEKEMEAKAREIRASFADQLAQLVEEEPGKFGNLTPSTDVAEWLRAIADKERLERKMDKL